jgi:hypothetical protein
MTVPNALLAILRRDHSVEDGIAQEVVATLIGRILGAFGFDDASADAPPEAAIISALGGQEYVSDVLRWRRERLLSTSIPPVT